jgi:transcriptional regulator with XRE-family HTH domain
MAKPSEDTFAGRLSYAMSKRGHRKAAGLAAELGVTESAISRWKSGHPITLEHAIALRRALSVSLDWLLCGDGSFEITEPPETRLPSLSPHTAREMIEFLHHFVQ